MFKKIVMSSIVTTGLLFAQSGVGINVNKNDLEVEGTLDSRNLAILQTSSTIYLGDFNFISKEDDDVKSKLVGTGFGATNRLEGVEGVELTFGAKLIISNVKDDNKNIDDWFSAMPLMGMIRYTFPPLMFNIPPVAIEGKVLYAPGALAFGDSDNYSEFRVSADIEMIENVKVYAGYRSIVTGY
ncbi:MAG TPA: hypothetical protein ENK99_02575, partial [Campylobacterales bacterium]|nr:hypothetical protein [Campylobacterales bacterium]